MSNHQRENGHVDIANTLIEELMKIHLSGREWQILMVIFRQTWGYCKLKEGKVFRDEKGMLVKKKMDTISHSQFEKFTGINRRKIWDILKKLSSKNMIIKTITKKGDINLCNYGIQKNSDRWRLSPKKGTVPKKGLRVSPKKGHTKEKIQKKIYNIHFNYKEGKFIGINDDFKSDLKKRYPNCDIDKQFRKMANWLIDNQNKKRQGKRSFIDNWMERDNQYQKEREESGIDNLQTLTSHLKE